jgi:hypothetical protein
MRCHLGWIEGLAIVFNPSDQCAAKAFQLDRNFELTIDLSIHDHIGDCLFEAQLKSERHVGRHAFLRPALNPS